MEATSAARDVAEAAGVEMKPTSAEGEVAEAAGVEVKATAAVGEVADAEAAGNGRDSSCWGVGGGSRGGSLSEGDSSCKGVSGGSRGGNAGDSSFRKSVEAESSWG